MAEMTWNIPLTGLTLKKVYDIPYLERDQDRQYLN